MKINYYSLLLLFILSCSHSNTGQSITEAMNETEPVSMIHVQGNTIGSRFNPPIGYTRIVVDSNTFGAWLRNLKLKEYGSDVLYYDGKPKRNSNIYISVVDMPISKKDLQQCADAVMRLRGEYLYKEKAYDKIHFNFISDGKPRYYTDFVDGDYSYGKFLKYMDYIFSYANTASLLNELEKVENVHAMRPGDIFIQKGNPYGHAVIVVDMAISDSTGKQVYMLAQSYMPAQETQILVNPMNKEISPWYEVNDKMIITPEWKFLPGDLRRFANK